jgi:hypothetical protein
MALKGVGCLNGTFASRLVPATKEDHKERGPKEIAEREGAKREVEGGGKCEE